jgi:hypothetical protein
MPLGKRYRPWAARACYLDNLRSDHRVDESRVRIHLLRNCEDLGRCLVAQECAHWASLSSQSRLEEHPRASELPPLLRPEPVVIAQVAQELLCLRLGQYRGYALAAEPVIQRVKHRGALQQGWPVEIPLWTDADAHVSTAASRRAGDKLTEGRTRPPQCARRSRLLSTQ